MKDTILPLVSHLKAIFFDLDDVLVFSEKTHSKSWELALPTFGVDPTQIDFQKYVGMSDMKQAILFKEHFNLKEDVEKLWDVKKDTFLDLINSGFESALGRNAFLEKVSKSYVIGVVSSSRKSVVHKILQSEKMTSFFHFVIAYEDCIRHKPDPLPYQNALAHVGILPHEALVIEDSISGITSALNASIPVIGLFKDQRPDQIIEGVRYFNHFDEINEALFD